MSDRMTVLQAKTAEALLKSGQSADVEHALATADLLIHRKLVALSPTGDFALRSETIEQAMTIAPKLCSPDVDISRGDDAAKVRRAQLRTGESSREPTPEQRAEVRRKLAALPPLPPYASDHDRVMRADERAKLLASVYSDMDGDPSGYDALDFGGVA